MGEKTEDQGNGKEKPYVPEFEIVEDPNDKGSKEGAADKGGYADERLSADQRTDEDEDDDASGDGTEVKVDTGTETAEQIEARREKRRAERRAQKARQQLARERDKRELAFLRTRNEQVEKRLIKLESSTDQRLTQSEVTVIDSRLAQLKAAQAECESALAEAHEAKNGKDIVQLTKALDDLRDGIKNLTKHRQTLQTAATDKSKGGGESDDDAGAGDGQQQDDGQQIRITPGVVKNARVFAARHPWVNPKGGDTDSNVVKMLDSELIDEGYDPSSASFWQELEGRMKQYLPHRMKGGKASEADLDVDEQDDPPRNGKANGGKKPNGGGPRMPSTSQNKGGGGNRFYLSPERKAALVEAGVWDDPVLRDKHIRQFKKWDEENADLLKTGR